MEYIDLGLSMKWANCNVGANLPGEYGEYFNYIDATKLKNIKIPTYEQWRELQDNCDCKLDKKKAGYIITGKNGNSIYLPIAGEGKNADAKIQHSVLGRVKAKLIACDRTVVLDKWFPTTKYCSNCVEKTNISLDERTFECTNCKTKEDRDIHAANNMIYFYHKYINASGTDVNKPVRKICYKEFANKFAKQESDTTSVCR